MTVRIMFILLFQIFCLEWTVVIANPLLGSIDGMQHIVNRKFLDDLTPRKIDDDSSSDFSSKSSLDKTDFETISNDSLANSPSDSESFIADTKSSPTDFSGSLNGSGRSDYPQKRSALVANQGFCSNNKASQGLKIKFKNAPRIRENAKLKRPTRDYCKEISQKVGLFLYPVSCGGPLVGEKSKPSQIFNCVPSFAPEIPSRSWFLEITRPTKYCCSDLDTSTLEFLAEDCYLVDTEVSIKHKWTNRKYSFYASHIRGSQDFNLKFYHFNPEMIP